ncbi:acyl-CoA thioesterase [Rhodovarius crocodyli]|uniref:Acyl-CoA thioesterase n=2 Tax=Rhodovarius crocodyli TaxID=1979269 RepID=A0A437M3J3_9PROT|nr:acyl-CoA thioesterase [Rhodovarius crocodyli]
MESSMKKPAPDQHDFHFWTDEKFRIADTDLNGHINNNAVGQFYEAGRGEIISSVLGPPAKRSIGAALARVQIDYLAEAHYPGMARIGSRIARLGTSSITIAQAIFVEGRCIGMAESVIVFLDKATRKPTPMPDAVRDGFTLLG